MWDDLEDDRPWFDPCAHADRLADDRALAYAAEQAVYDTDPVAYLLRERFGQPGSLNREANAPLPRPVQPRFVTRPGWMLDDQLSTIRRRRILNRALEPNQGIHYRRKAHPA